jgi:uncharacterized protein (TIGR03067 family)
MRTTVLALAATYLALAAHAAPAPLPRPDPTKEDLKKMQGTWVQVRPRGDIRVEITEARIQWWTRGGSLMTEWAIKLDATRKPKALDGAALGINMRWRAIYRLEGDTLTICYHTSRRPAKFVSSPADRVWVEVFKRLKKP